jgi:hypothetical protein
MQFSIKWLLVATGFVCVSLVALLYANDLFRAAFRSAVLLSILTALTGAIWSDGKRSAFCGGYVLFSLPFLTVYFGFKSSSDHFATHLLNAIHSKSFSTSSEVIDGPFYPSLFDGDVLSTTPIQPGAVRVTFIRPKRQHFVEIGHAVLSIVLSVIGGTVAVWFYRHRTRNSAAGD